MRNRALLGFFVLLAGALHLFISVFMLIFLPVESSLVLSTIVFRVSQILVAIVALIASFMIFREHQNMRMFAFFATGFLLAATLSLFVTSFQADHMIFFAYGLVLFLSSLLVVILCFGMTQDLLYLSNSVTIFSLVNAIALSVEREQVLTLIYVIPVLLLVIATLFLLLKDRRFSS